MKHLLTLIGCVAVLAWALPLSACPGPNIDAGYLASGMRSQMASDLKDAGNLRDLLARRAAGEVRERETESDPDSVSGVSLDRARGKGTAPKTGPAPGNARRMARAIGRDRAVVPGNKTVRAAKGNEVDSVTSNRSIPLPGSRALPGKPRQALCRL